MKKLHALVATTSLLSISTAFTVACGDDTEEASPSAVDGGTATNDATSDAATPTPTPPDAGLDAASQITTLTFAAKVGTETFSCNATFQLGTPSTAVTPLDFRFYVSEVELVRADGTRAPLALVPDGKWQLDDVALLDFENGAAGCASNGTPDTNAVVRGIAAPGSYTGVRFVVGVPFAKNHGNQATAPSPLNLGQMFWSWRSGYKFLKIDGQPEADAGPRFNLHLGSVGCLGEDPADGGAVTSCEKPNRVLVSLSAEAPLDFGTKRVVIDWAAILAGSDVTVNGGGPGGCMSGTTDPECEPVFDRLGIDLATGAPKPGGAAFRLE